MGKVVLLPTASGEYDPAQFLGLVQNELDERPPDCEIVSTMAVVLDANGQLSLHTSSTDSDRNLALITVVKQYLVDQYMMNLQGGLYRIEEGPDGAA